MQTDVAEEYFYNILDISWSEKSDILCKQHAWNTII